MKYCWSCGAELRGTNPSFCSECGIELGEDKPQPKRNVGRTNPVNTGTVDNFREVQRAYDMNEYNRALIYIDDAINENPNNTYYLNFKARILRQLHRFKESKDTLIESLNIEENLDARYGLALDMAMNGDNSAISLYESAETNYKNNAEYYAKLAGLYYILGDYNQVLSMAEKALTLDSKNGLALFYTGSVQSVKENFNAANDALGESLNYLDPSSEEYPTIYFYRTHNSLITMNELLDKNNQNISTILNNAVNDAQEAYHLFQTNYNTNKDFLFVNYGLDLVRKALKDLVDYNYFGVDFHTRFGVDFAHKMQDLTDAYVNIRNEDTVILKMKGDMYGRLGFHDKAVEYFDKVLRTKEPDFRVLGYKGTSLLELGRIQEAENCLKQMYIFLEDEINNNPKDIYLRREMAIVLIQLGRRRDASNCYKEILRIDSNAPFVEQDRNHFRL